MARAKHTHGSRHLKPKLLRETITTTKTIVRGPCVSRKFVDWDVPAAMLGLLRVSHERRQFRSTAVLAKFLTTIIIIICVHVSSVIPK